MVKIEIFVVLNNSDQRENNFHFLKKIGVRRASGFQIKAQCLHF